MIHDLQMAKNAISTPMRFYNLTNNPNLILRENINECRIKRARRSEPETYHLKLRKDMQISHNIYFVEVLI